MSANGTIELTQAQDFLLGLIQKYNAVEAVSKAFKDDSNSVESSEVETVATNEMQVELPEMLVVDFEAAFPNENLSVCLSGALEKILEHYVKFGA